MRLRSAFPKLQNLTPIFLIFTLLFIYLFNFTTTVKASDPVDSGDGSDGSLTINVNTVDNPVDSSASGTAGSFTLTATNSSFAVGQKILIHQTQGVGAGNWEINKVASYVPGTITVIEPLAHTYSGKAQVLVLRQYTNVDINSGVIWSAKAWDGTTGGILAYLANGIVTINGNLSANGGDGSFTTVEDGGVGIGGGFRGGGVGFSSDGLQGEGVNGLGTESTASNSNGGGGGNRGGSDTGGGGGGNGLPGLNGFNGGLGGLVAGTTDLITMVFGGGGGGSTQDYQPDGTGGGGAGGGIIYIAATNVSMGSAGSITANGGNGGVQNGAGGAGGSILLKTQTITLGANQITTTGGLGNNGGGNGGDGRIIIEGDRSDGALVVSTNTVDNPIDSSASGTSESSTLSANNSLFVSGQKILIHQTRGTNVGAYEVNQILSYTTGTITTVNPLINNYNNTGTDRAQVKVVPTYSSVTIDNGVTFSAKDWNGTVGGILAFRSTGTVTVNGTILANGGNGSHTTTEDGGGGIGGGFRGGGVGFSSNGIQGESILGVGTESTAANSNGGGGGNRGGGDTGGGGGGNGAPGLSGFDGGIGGSTAGTTTLTTMVFGGGGGGSTQDYQPDGTGGGGSGGGIVFIDTDIINTENGLIAANGGNGGNQNGAGGAGGSIFLKANVATLGMNKVLATGGTGSNVGGSGGVGRVRIEYCDSLSGFTNPSASTQQLICNQPPTVNAGGPYQVNEGGLVMVSASGSDPENETLTYAWDLDNNGSFETSGQSVSFSAAGLDGPSSKTIAVQVTDNGNLTATDSTTVTINNLAPVVGIITAPMVPVQVNTLVSTGASFTDAGIPDTHTAIWDWQDGTSTGVVTESNGSGTVAGSHTYTTPGVYTISLTVTDDDLASGTNQFMYIVVYNPAGGFVTGSGRYNASAGSIPSAPLESGMTNFGTNAKYVNNILTGATRLTFRDGQYAFDFDSASYDWLVITNGNQAQLHGSGTVNGSGSYTFQLTALDDSPDTVRIQIWDGTNTVIYDNNTSPLTNGNISIHN